MSQETTGAEYLLRFESKSQKNEAEKIAIDSSKSLKYLIIDCLLEKYPVLKIKENKTNQ